MTYFDFEGHRVFYERDGSGSPILFLPNATLDGKLWEFQADHFKATHDVIVVDLPGFGRSDRITPSLDLWVRWLGRFVDDLGLAPVALVGNCMGSLTALHYAAANPDNVSALVLIHTLDKDVGNAGPMGGGGVSPRSTPGSTSSASATPATPAPSRRPRHWPTPRRSAGSGAPPTSCCPTRSARASSTSCTQPTSTSFPGGATRWRGRRHRS